MASVSLASLPTKRSWSAASPRFSAISISGMLNSLVEPGENAPPPVSSVRRSVVPTVPAIWTVSVFVVVAAPHG